MLALGYSARNHLHIAKDNPPDSGRVVFYSQSAAQTAAQSAAGKTKHPQETAGVSVMIVAMPLRALALQRQARDAEEHKQARGRLGDYRRSRANR